MGGERSRSPEAEKELPSVQPLAYLNDTDAFVLLSQQHHSITAFLQYFTVDRYSSTASCQAPYIVWKSV